MEEQIGGNHAMALRLLNSAVGYFRSHSDGRASDVATSNCKVCGEVQSYILRSGTPKIPVGVLIITIWRLLKFRFVNNSC